MPRIKDEGMPYYEYELPDDTNWEDEYGEVDAELVEGDRGGHLPINQFKSARREERRNNRRKMGVSGRSVFELQRLRARPMKPRRRRI